MTQETLPVYGVDDATYQAAGGLEGITRIVDRFYDLMDSLPAAKVLRDMHGDDLALSRQKLTYFLSGWMGGPKLFAEHFGPINIPIAHSHLHVDEESKNSWLHCMDLALQQLDYPNDFRNYLMQKLAVPAESIRLMSGLHPGHAATKQIP